jgi:hypothetical protein
MQKLLSLIMIIYFSISTVYAENISIKLPIRSEKGDSVPITVLAHKPINPGDTLIIKGDGKVALKLNTNSNPITEVSTRLRLIKGSVSVSITRGDGNIDKITQNTEIITMANSPQENGQKSKKYRSKVKKGKIKILFSNSMPLDNYIQQVNILTNRGNLNISMTPVLAKNPYLGIRGKYDFKNVSVDVKINNGSKYSIANIVTPKNNSHSTISNSENSCSKDDILKMLTAGYTKNEVDGLCLGKTGHATQKNNTDNNREIKTKIAKILRNDKKFSREFLQTIKMTYSNNVLVFYDNCPRIIEINNKRLSKEYKKKEEERKRQEAKGGYSWGGFLNTMGGDNAFSRSFRFKDECYAMLDRAKKLAKTVEGVQSVEILK